MPTADRWLLPDGVEELLPEQAARVEALRREILDLYRSWGYQLVIPSLIEYTESLLIGLGEDLDWHTFKVTDQLSGRQLAIRPDITPQAARIDAHALQQSGPTRLCYAGSVLHTRPRSASASRSPIQIGAELYGGSGLAADIEVIGLMLETLQAAGSRSVTLDLGHQAIVATLLDAAQFSAPDRRAYFDALQQKSTARIDEILTRSLTDGATRAWLGALAGLHGDDGVLARARAVLAGAPAVVAGCLDDLERIAATVRQRYPDVVVHFDLAELHGYHYHTGLVFAAYVPGVGQAVANGGRYDDIGRVFGRARPATGFNTDLKTLLGLAPDPGGDGASVIFAPPSDDPDWWLAVQGLRARGRVVVCGVGGEEPWTGARLLRRGDEWQVEEGEPDGSS